MRLPVFLPRITSPYARNFIATVASTWTSVIWSTWRDIFKMWAIEWTVKTFILGRLYNFSIMEYIHGMEYIHAWRTQKYSPITRPSIIPSSYHYLVMYVLMDEVSNNNVYRQGRCCLLQILNPWIWLNADPPSFVEVQPVSVWMWPVLWSGGLFWNYYFCGGWGNQKCLSKSFQRSENTLRTQPVIRDHYIPLVCLNYQIL